MKIPWSRTFPFLYQGSSKHKRWWKSFTQQLKQALSQHQGESFAQQQPEDYFHQIRLRRKFFVRATPALCSIPIQKRRRNSAGNIHGPSTLINYEILPVHHHLSGAWSICEEPLA